MAGPQCCVPAPPSEHQYPVGKEEVFGHLNSYIVSPSSPKAAVLLATDVFGFQVPNFRKLADKIAAAGYLVVAPDFLDNDPYNPGRTKTIHEWLQKHDPVKITEEAKKIIVVLKSKGFTSIGATGFCLGAKVVVELAKENYIQAAVLCHPSFVTEEDIKAVKTHIAILAAEMDQVTPPELVKSFAAILDSRNEVESFVNIYSEAAHGWTVRYDINDEKAAKLADEAHCKLLEWFDKYL